MILRYLILFVLLNYIKVYCQDNTIIFDGKDDYVLIPHSESFDNIKDIEFIFDFKINSLYSLKSGLNKSRQFIFFKKNPLKHFNEGIAIYYEEFSSSLFVTVSSCNGKQIHLSTGKNTVNINQWYKSKVRIISHQLFIELNIISFSRLLDFDLCFSDQPLMLGGRNNSKLEKEIYGGMFSGELRNIKIRAKNDNDFSDLFIQGSSNSTNILDESINHNDGFIVNGNLPDEIDSDLNIDINPFPAKEFTNISFFNPKVNNVFVYLENLEGKRIRNLFDGLLSKGDNSIKVDLADISTGVYILSLYFEKFEERRLLIVTR